MGYKIIPLDELKQDLEPWRDMLKKYGSPYYDMPFCTARMKTEPFEKYCNDVFGKTTMNDGLVLDLMSQNGCQLRF